MATYPISPVNEVVYGDEGIYLRFYATYADEYDILWSSDGETWNRILVLKDGGYTPDYAYISANTLPNGIITWQIRELNGSSWSDWSQPVSFSVTYRATPPEPDPDPEPITVLPPTIGTLLLEIVQPDGLDSVFANTYISGISKVKIKANVSGGTYPIADNGVRFSYPEYSGSVSMQIPSEAVLYEGVTPNTINGNTTFTVTAVDTQGNYAQKTINLTDVQPYAKPSLVIDQCYRCNSSGSQVEGGAYYKIKVTATCSSVNGLNEIYSPSSVTQVGANDPPRGITVGILGASTRYYLINGVLSSRLSGMSNEDSVYVLHVEVVDKVGSKTDANYSLAGKLRDVVIFRDTTNNTAHVGVGMAPGGSVNTTLELPPNASIIIGEQDLIAWLQQKLGEQFPGWNSQ